MAQAPPLLLVQPAAAARTGRRRVAGQQGGREGGAGAEGGGGVAGGLVAAAEAQGAAAAAAAAPSTVCQGRTRRCWPRICRRRRRGSATGREGAGGRRHGGSRWGGCGEVSGGVCSVQRRAVFASGQRRHVWVGVLSSGEEKQGSCTSLMALCSVNQCYTWAKARGL